MRAARFYQKASERGQGALEAEKTRVTASFWHLAKALLYKTKAFSQEEESRAKATIRQEVFHSFSTGTPADWVRSLKPLERRLELAAAWLQRNPGKYVAAPYAEVIAGRGYFDAGNQFGFAGTEKWYQAEQRNRKHRFSGKGGLERALDEALTELHQRRRLDAGQQRVQASERAKLLDYNRLHLYHWRKLRQLGGEEALYRFSVRLEAEHLLYHTS